MIIKKEENIEQNAELIALFISLKKTWSSRERTLIKDARIAEGKGYKVVILCLKDSFLDINSKKENFNIIYHTGKIQLNFLKWYKYRYLANYINSQNITIIHCYDLNIIWPVCFILRKNKKTCLFFTILEGPKKIFFEFWHRALLSRIDQVFVRSKSMAEEVYLRLGIHPRKITVLGFGIETTEFKKSDIQKIKKELDVTSDTLSVGSLIPPHVENLELIFPLIYAINGYNQKHMGRVSLRLIMISEQKWNKNPIYQDLIRFIKDAGCEDNILFYSNSTIENFQRSVDLWITPFEGQHLSEFAVKSIFLGVPFLTARSSEGMDFLGQYSEVGEAYRPDDSFGLREKLEIILSDKKRYVKAITKFMPNINASHSMDFYTRSLLMRYSKTLNARKRVADKVIGVNSKKLG